MPYNGITAAQAAYDPGSMQRYLEGLESHNVVIQRAAGVATGKTNSPADPPTSPSWTIVGVDGHTIIDITLPQSQRPITQTVGRQIANAGINMNPTATPIYVQLQSSLNLTFDAAGSVVTYGGDTGTTQTHFDITDHPNELRFWQFRAKYQNSGWTDWIQWINPAFCGPVAVQSGLLRNSSTVINNAATTPQGANPCTQHLTTTRIDVANSVWSAGTNQPSLSYNSGFVDPGSFGTFLVYAKDPNRAGGTVTFYTTTNSSDITADDSIIYFGKITTAGGGGGSGSGGGGGTCCKAGVPYILADGTPKDCSLLAKGEALRGIDGGTEIIQRIVVHPDRPCFHLEFDATGKLTKKQYIGNFTVYQIELDRTHTFLAGQNNVIDGACSTHTIQYAGGGFTDVFSAVQDETFNIIAGSCGSHNFLKA